MAKEDDQDSLEAAYEEGNACYKAGNFSAAIQAWGRGISRYHHILSLHSSQQLPPDLKALLAKCYNNRAQAYLQLREYESSEGDCSETLRLDPTNVKALIRRATALVALERVKEARNALDRALKLNPPAILLKSINRLRDQVKTMGQMIYADADAKEASGLVDPNQTLRLYYKTPPPSTAYLDRSQHEVSIYLANEFGLWRRSDFPGVGKGQEALPLIFTVYDRGEGCIEPSQHVGIEVVQIFEEEDENQEEPVVLEGRRMNGSSSQEVVLRRGSSCRAKVKICFTLLPSSSVRQQQQQQQQQQGGMEEEEGEEEASLEVHLMVSLPVAHLNREVLPVISLSTRLLRASPSSSSLSSSFRQSFPLEGQRHQQQENEQNVDAMLGIQSCRAVYVPALKGRRIIIAESPGQTGLAGKIWDSGYKLTEFLAARSELTCRPKRCIELGAGTGVSGIVAALLGADVVITDLEMAVPLIARNIELNMPSLASSLPEKCGCGVAKAGAYAWGSREQQAALPSLRHANGRDSAAAASSEREKDTSLLRRDEGGCSAAAAKAAAAAAAASSHDEGKEDRNTFDVILMADVVYDPSTYLPLVQALCDLSHPETLVILAFRERHPDNALFFEAVRKQFEVTEIPFTPSSMETALSPSSSLSTAAIDDNGQGGGVKACLDVKMFEMRLLPTARLSSPTQNSS